MKKQRRKPSRPKARPAAAEVAAKPSPDRRQVLRYLRNGGIAAVVLGGGGYYSVSSVRATIAEHDLTRIGKGSPAVVQIHDPNCTQCTALQRQTRQALRTLDDPRLEYVVANIRTSEGRAYAAQHGVQHVTLLLVDGRGRVQNILAGPNQADRLEAAFADHLARFGL
ncbi:MAG: hypothetical protein AAGF22_09480 [Pseudomonadota bacterium]